MSDKPYVSIGVTTFNRRELLAETLASILAQTFVDFEVIVGNDNVDEPLTQEMLGINDRRVRIVNRSVNLGEIGNMNELLAQSQGRYFTWLADDDLYMPDFLQEVRNAHEQYGPVSCVFTNYASGATCKTDRDTYAARIKPITGRDFLRDYMARKIHAIGCYGVFEAQYLRNIGGMVRLGTGFSPYSDNLLVIKAGLLAKLCYIDAPLIFFRTHPDSISYASPDIMAYVSAQEDLCREAVEIFRSEPLLADLRQNLYHLLSYWCLTFTLHVLERSETHFPSAFIWPYIRFVRRCSSDLGVMRFRLIGVVFSSLFNRWATTFRRRARALLLGGERR